MNFSNLSKAQLLYSYNAEETVVRPIDFDAITHANAPPKTPKDVRDYLNNVVARMNQHLAVVMHGPMTGKIMVTRQSRIAVNLVLYCVRGNIYPFIFENHKHKPLSHRKLSHLNLIGF